MPDFEGKPIRMRGYYRAVKRKEPWALRIEARRSNILVYHMLLAYRNTDFRQFVYANNPLLAIIPKDDSGGLYVPVSFTIK
jgi:hypothetical protein